jgi:cellulose synthase/poly-beta-1,6-N-acetylglucosamine synthase-like glycosyltransferase
MELWIFTGTCLAAILALVYAGFVAVCIRGAYSLRRLGKAKAPRVHPSVSVIVPLRNEANNASTTLQALANQDYEGNWEVHCVDDRSDDATPQILKEFCSVNPKFTWHSISKDAPAVTSPKKRALAEGFARSQGEILMTTDADCLPPSGWMRSLASRFSPGIDIVQGPKRMRPGKRWLHRYQRMEVFGLVSIEAASFALGRPMLASAPSLAYRRSLYEKVGGFEGIEDSVSGDDDLLVRKMSHVPEVGVTYCPDASACVETGNEETWIGLLRQRARWSSNGAHYAEKGFVATLVGLYLFYLVLLVSPFAALAGLCPAWAPALLWIWKIGWNAWFLGLTEKSLGQPWKWSDLIWTEAMHVPMVLLAVPLGHLGWTRWK